MGNVVWFMDCRGWGMWCGSWMGVDGECVCSWIDMEDRRIERIVNGGNLKLKQI